MTSIEYDEHVSINAPLPPDSLETDSEAEPLLKRAAPKSVRFNSSAESERRRNELRGIDLRGGEKVGIQKQSFLFRLAKRLRPEHPLKYYLHPRRLFLPFLLLMLVGVATTNRVMFRKMLYPMKNYPYFISQLSTIIYLPLFWPIVFFFMCFTKRIDKEQLRFPKWKFLIMGGLDAFAGVMMIFGGNQTSGSMQQLLTQAVIPTTMFFSWMVSLRIFRRILNVRYKWGHYLGATIIMSGILLALIPKMVEGSGSNTIFGIIVFLASNIPNAFSGVYKEVAFKGAVDLDVFYVNAWVALWQFLVGMLFFPITAIPGFGGLTFKEIPGNIADGAKCLVGINSAPDDDCHWSAVMVSGYIAANLCYNILILWVIKYSSAALLTVASAIVLPLANICFTLHFIMGSNATSLSAYDIAALFIILAGLIIYRLMKESGPSEEAAAAGEVIVEDYGPVVFNSGIAQPEPIVIGVRPEHQARNVTQLRSAYFSRLGVRPTNANNTHNSVRNYQSFMEDGGSSSDYQASSPSFEDQRRRGDEDDELDPEEAISNASETDHLI